MPRSLKQERQHLEEEERRLQERRARLAEAEQKQAMETVAKSGLLKLDGDRLGALMKRIKTLGIDEVEKRLEAQPEGRSRQSRDTATGGASGLS